MKSKPALTFGIAIATLFSNAAVATTCSCASVPLANNLQSGSTQSQRFVLALSYEYHEMNDLISGSDNVRDETNRRRSSNAVVVEMGYGFSQEWSIAYLTNYIAHDRQIGTSTSAEQTTEGLGDSLVLLKYVPKTISVFNQQEYGVGLGYKWSTGSNNQRNQLGIRYSEDMQPGAGADGMLIWAYYALAFSRDAKNTVHVALNRSFNEANSFNYQVGNDVNLSVAWQSQLSDDWRFSGQVNWREAEADKRFGADIPNTGGKWLDLKPAIQYRLTEDTSIRLGFTYPLTRRLAGALQFTTSKAWSIGVVSQF